MSWLWQRDDDAQYRRRIEESAGISQGCSIRTSLAMNPVQATESERASGNAAFPATLWTVVLQARSENPREAIEALHALCVRYHRAIHAWFQRSRPDWVPPSKAEEWAQDFFVFVHEKNPFRHLEQRDSRFRAFLVTCLKNFLRDKLAAERAAKRGGGAEHLELDESILSGSSENMAVTLDCELAVSVHERVLRRIQEEWTSKGHVARYNALHPHILGLQPEVSYEELAQSLELTPNHLRKIVFDLRDAYYDHLRSEVRELVADPQALDDEMRYLATLLARGASTPL
jgi:DNA-directed RNA polymerase specialized sigma24 family protein